MVKIIFSRIGKKKNPFYRLIAVDKQKDPWGNSLEILGNYNPQTKQLIINEEHVNDWLKKGAQPSATVHNLLVEKGIIKAKKVRVSTISKKRAEKLEKKEKDAKAKEAAPAAEAAKPAAIEKAPEKTEKPAATSPEPATAQPAAPKTDAQPAADEAK